MEAGWPGLGLVLVPLTLRLARRLLSGFVRLASRDPPLLLVFLVRRPLRGARPPRPLSLPPTRYRASALASPFLHRVPIPTVALHPFPRLDASSRRYLSIQRVEENWKRERKEGEKEKESWNLEKLKVRNWLIVSRKVLIDRVRIVSWKKESSNLKRRPFLPYVFPFNFSNLHLSTHPISAHGVPPKYPEDDKARANICPVPSPVSFVSRNRGGGGGDFFSKNRNEKRKSDPLSSRRQRSRETERERWSVYLSSVHAKHTEGVLGQTRAGSPFLNIMRGIMRPRTYLAKFSVSVAAGRRL